MNQKDKKFRICTKTLFLTYPKTPLDLREIKEILSIRLYKHNIIEYALSKEKHKDGTPHAHVWIKLTKKLDTKNPRLLDITKEGVTYHGEYENANDRTHSIEYILKDCNIENPQEALVSQGIKDRLTKEGTLKGVEAAMIDLAEEGKVWEALNLLKEEKPKDYLHKHISLRKSLTDIALVKKGLIKPRFSLKDYVIDQPLQEALESLNDKKTLILMGEPGTGKTQLISTYLKETMKLTPLIINNLDSLRYFKDGVHNAIVFDDCPGWDNKSREDIIKLVDSEGPTTHNIKHGSVAINDVTPRCLIMNPPIPSVFLTEDKAINRRIKLHTLSTPMIPHTPL